MLVLTMSFFQDLLMLPRCKVSFSSLGLAAHSRPRICANVHVTLGHENERGDATNLPLQSSHIESSSQAGISTQIPSILHTASTSDFA